MVNVNNQTVMTQGQGQFLFGRIPVFNIFITPAYNKTKVAISAWVAPSVRVGVGVCFRTALCLEPLSHLGLAAVCHYS